MRTGHEPPVYLLIGHITRDRFISPRPHERVGGTAFYAGVAARRLGWRVRIVTAVAKDEDLPPELSGAEVHRVPSPQTTTFAIEERPEGRILRLLARATTIASADVPNAWTDADVVHLAPVAGEVSPDIVARFRGKFVGATAQGWLRPGGPWIGGAPGPKGESPPGIEALSALVVSAEDLHRWGSAGPRDTARAISARGPVVALTFGRDGCSVFASGAEEDVAAFPVREVDTTGAGDVFAAAFFIRLSLTRNPVPSARFASCVAGLSVQGIGASSIPDLVDRVHGSKFRDPR